MGEGLFLAACHDYVLSVYLLLLLFVWQNKISSTIYVVGSGLNVYKCILYIYVVHI